MFSTIEVEKLLEYRDKQWKDIILEQWGVNVLNSVWPVVREKMTIIMPYEEPLYIWDDLKGKFVPIDD